MLAIAFDTDFGTKLYKTWPPPPIELVQKKKTAKIVAEISKESAKNQLVSDCIHLSRLHTPVDANEILDRKDTKSGGGGDWPLATSIKWLNGQTIIKCINEQNHEPLYNEKSADPGVLVDWVPFQPSLLPSY